MVYDSLRVLVMRRGLISDTLRPPAGRR